MPHIHIPDESPPSQPISQIILVPIASVAGPHPPAVPLFSRVTLALRAAGLSPQECNVALLDYRGLARQEIAQQLHLAPSTIKTYWQRIYQKLGIRQRSQLRQWLHAQEAGLDPLGRTHTTDVPPLGGQECPPRAD